MSTPWAQESGNASGDLTFWPVWVVLGIPAVVCVALHRVGREDAEQLRLTGHSAGVLPAEISLKQWEDEAERWADHPVEFLSNKALLAHPMVLGCSVSCATGLQRWSASTCSGTEKSTL